MINRYPMINIIVYHDLIVGNVISRMGSKNAISSLQVYVLSGLLPSLAAPSGLRPSLCLLRTLGFHSFYIGYYPQASALALPLPPHFLSWGASVGRMKTG